MVTEKVSKDGNDNIISMSRSTTLQRLGVSAAIPAISTFLLADSSFKITDFTNIKVIGVYFAIAIAFIVIFTLLNSLPLIQIYFDPANDRLSYFRFLLFKKEIPLSIINDIVPQTKTSRTYSKGKSTTQYKTDIFIITDDGDYQVEVWERAKLNEFKTKFKLAQKQLTKETT